MLVINEVYLDPVKGSLHVVVQNKNNAVVSPSTYMNAALYVNPHNAALPWSWPLYKIDPARSSLRRAIDFDTKKVFSEATPLRVGLKGIASDGEWAGTPMPRAAFPRKSDKIKFAHNHGIAKPLESRASAGHGERRVQTDSGIRGTAAPGLPGHSEPDPVAVIHRLSPIPATVGNRLTIRGENFGGTQRRVFLKLEGGWRTAGSLTSDGVVETEQFVPLQEAPVECSVTSWSDRRIVVTIPESLRSVVGETEKVGRVYLELPRYDHDIRVGPNPERVTPSIREISTTTIREGETLVIEGSNFLSDSPGTVQFEFSGSILNGRIEEWRDTYIVSVFPERLDDLPEVTGVVKVRNHAGLETARGITYEPSLPTGSYRHTCEDAYIEGSTLHARCRTHTGEMRDAYLYNYHECRNEITNFLGFLICQQERVPGGSYQDSCTNAHLDHDSNLIAVCRTNRGTERYTILRDRFGCEDISNNNGHLTCNR